MEFILVLSNKACRSDRLFGVTRFLSDLASSQVLWQAFRTIVKPMIYTADFFIYMVKYLMILSKGG
jgi:hypothetical protein